MNVILHCYSTCDEMTQALSIFQSHIFGVREVHYSHRHEVPQSWPPAILMLWIRNERIAALNCYVSYEWMNIYWQKSAIAPSAAAIMLFNGHATYNEGNVTASLSSWYILTADQDCFAWKARHDIHINATYRRLMWWNLIIWKGNLKQVPNKGLGYGIFLSEVNI